MKRIFEFLFRSSKVSGNADSVNKSTNKETQTRSQNCFRSKSISSDEEIRWKKEIFDMTMDPREWMARFGHNILVGDYRVYKYQDQKFDKWIHEAFGALTQEGLEKLWKEFLTEDEISKNRKAYENF